MFADSCAVEAGAHARRRYRDARRAKARSEWRGAAKMVAVTAAALVAGGIVGGTPRLLAAMMFGFTVGLLLVLWLLGDPHQLTWLWGAMGEEETERELKKLDPSRWSAEHDIERARGGNWDHVVTGPPGTFMLETKHLGSAPVLVEGDRLVSGRTRIPGSQFRHAALALKEARSLSGWVQAVVVIWGDFPQRIVLHERVAYVAGEEVVGWLESQT